MVLYRLSVLEELWIVNGQSMLKEWLVYVLENTICVKDHLTTNKCFLKYNIVSSYCIVYNKKSEILQKYGSTTKHNLSG